MIPLTSSLPLGAVLAVQPPSAVQALAFVPFHATVVEPPLAMLGGVAVTVTTGFGGRATVTTAEAELTPPKPLQVSVYVAVVVGLTTCWPLAGIAPVQLPDAVHDVAPVALHVNVALPPITIVAEEAEIATTGAVTAGGELLPPEQAASSSAKTEIGAAARQERQVTGASRAA